MAKEKEPTAAPDPTPLADRIVVRHHSSHERSDDQAEVLVSGKRVGYISYGEGHPFSLLPKDYLGFKPTAAELRTIIATARERVAALAAAAQQESDEVAQLLAGQ